MKFIFPLLCAMFLFSEVSTGQTQGEMTENACTSYKKADAELNSVYRRILKEKEYASDTLFVKNMKEAQRAWVKFRDAQVHAIYPHDREPNYYGSVYPMCLCGALEKLTRDRITQLHVWLEGVEEGDLCTESVKTK